MNKIILVCSECLQNNYSTNKSSGNNKRIEVKKFCPKCNKHTIHLENK